MRVATICGDQFNNYEVYENKLDDINPSLVITDGNYKFAKKYCIERDIPTISYLEFEEGVTRSAEILQRCDKLVVFCKNILPIIDAAKIECKMVEVVDNW